MTYNLHPRFKTKHWQALYEAPILNIATLKNVTSDGAAFVVIDAEPWGADDSKPAEIGISILPPVDPNFNYSVYALPMTFDAVSSYNGAETHWIRIIDRERREKHRERHRYGKHYYVRSEEVELVILDIIHSFQATNCKALSNSPLILTGFALVFELRVLSNLYPNILNHFTYWLDIQEVANSLSGTLNPGLSDTLIACGFRSHEENLPSGISQHNAATDAIRTTAILIQFLRFKDSEERLIITHSKKKKQKPSWKRSNTPAMSEEKRLWRGARPRPKEFFPYTRVSRTSGFGNLPVQHLFDLFAHFNPTAVGINSGKAYGWVCLPSLEALQTFVESMNGKTVNDGEDGDIWTVISDYNPNIVPARDWGQLRSNLQAVADEKRVQRRLKRETKSEDFLDTLILMQE
ncbi:hypothetical protein GGI43DRAFT_430213 [Trichoderma evansii]